MARPCALLPLFAAFALVPAARAQPAPEAAAQPASAPPARLVSFGVGKLTLEVPVALSVRAEGVGGYPLDRYGTQQPGGVAVSPRARVGLRLDSKKAWDGKRLVFEYEHDVPTGTWSSREAVTGTALPDTQPLDTALRKASAKFSAGKLQLGAGLTTSHWGLGLVANDGDHGWTPGSARFTDPRGGDRVLRGQVGTGPYGAAAISGALAADLVWDDDVLLTGRELPDGAAPDKAWQVVAALMAGAPDQQRFAGVYAVHRRQAAGDGRVLQATVLDATGKLAFELAPKRTLTVEAEAALLLGTTDLATTPEHPTQGVRQLGVAARATYEAEKFGGVLDVLFASGDQNTDDGVQTGFKADPNFELGLFMFRHVIAAQSGRAAATAGDLGIVGVPADGLERYPSRGSPTNTLTFFPRGFFRPAKGLEIYGGPLVAVAAEPPTDPLNTRVAGGSPRNALDGAGRYLGTELDLGARWRLVKGAHDVTVGLEGGLLLPGAAFADAAGTAMDPVFGGRTTVDYRF